MNKGVPVEVMREKILQWHPNWNVEAWEASKVAAIYRSEQRKQIPKIMEFYGLKQ